MKRLLVLVLLLPLAACGTGGGGEQPRTITVLAASSLTDAFGKLAPRFQADHDVTVQFSFGSSTDLAGQAADGAPGDVLATADETSMKLAQDAGVTGAARPFATNRLVIVTPPDNPAGIAGLGDLAGATWVRCSDDAPCGKVAVAVLDDHGITARPASLEEDARSTLDKVTSGEADAALVYASDARSAGDSVRTIPIAGSERETTTYYITALDQSTDPGLARAWVDLVESPAGQRALKDAGFGTP